MTPLIFTTDDELIKVDIDKMVYATSEDNYVQLLFRNGQSVMVCMTVPALEEQITNAVANSKAQRSQSDNTNDNAGCNDSSFTLIGCRYIVNNRYIMQINILKQQLVLSDFDTMRPIILNVSKEALKALKQRMTSTDTVENNSNNVYI